MPARPAVAPGFCPKEVAAEGAVAPSRSYWAESLEDMGDARRIDIESFGQLPWPQILPVEQFLQFFLHRRYFLQI